MADISVQSAGVQRATNNSCMKVYDESEYSYCPCCSGELEDGDEEIRPCPKCGGCLHWDGDSLWECSNCD